MMLRCPPFFSTRQISESFVKVLEIADAERRRDQKVSSGKEKAETILPERDNPVESGRLHLLAADGHHAFRCPHRQDVWVPGGETKGSRRFPVAMSSICSGWKG